MSIVFTACYAVARKNVIVSLLVYMKINDSWPIELLANIV